MILSMGPISVLCSVILSSSALADDSYLCVAEHKAGFVFDKNSGQWDSARFKTDSKYVITKAKEGKHSWVVREVGSKSLSYSCDEGFTKFGSLICDGLFDGLLGEFRMSKANLRFLNTYMFGYWTDDAGGPHYVESTNIPHMEIGKCSPM